jgi:hypothetical protein
VCGYVSPAPLRFGDYDVCVEREAWTPLQNRVPVVERGEWSGWAHYVKGTVGLVELFLRIGFLFDRGSECGWAHYVEETEEDREAFLRIRFFRTGRF